MMTTIQTGFCHCGCGEQTNIAAWSDESRGMVKGEPRRFVKGHGRRLPATCVTELDDFMLGWIVGLVEADGCIGAYRNGSPAMAPKVMVASSDLPVLRRVQRTLNCGGIYANNGDNGITKKQMYQWQTTTRADALAVIDLIYEYLSTRRRAQVRRALRLANVGRN